MTSTTILEDLLKKTAGFTNAETTIVLNCFVPSILKKKTVILKTGDTAKEIYFVTKGCLRLFYEKEGKDISAYFFTENMFAGAYDSFVSQRASRHSIETFEDCEILKLSRSKLNKLYSQLPKMNEFIRKIIEARFFDLHNLFTSQILDSPEERYVNLLRTRGDLIKRIPQHHIATFLGITPASLSRIRRRIAKSRKSLS